jgi:hypothetical protein
MMILHRLVLQIVILIKNLNPPILNNNIQDQEKLLDLVFLRAAFLLE